MPGRLRRPFLPDRGSTAAKRRLVFFWAVLMLVPSVTEGGMILSEDVTVTERKEWWPRPHEYLIDSMDLGALSPFARLLAMPCPMVTPQLAAAMRSGTKAAPPLEEWDKIIADAAAEHGLPYNLIAAVIHTESRFHADAVSPKGAVGAMQIMPETQEHLGLEDPYDARANVMAGSAFLKKQLDTFGSVDLALAAYNAGPGNVRKYGGIPPFAETVGYVEQVNAYKNALDEQTPPSGTERNESHE